MSGPDYWQMHQLQQEREEATADVLRAIAAAGMRAEADFLAAEMGVQYRPVEQRTYPLWDGQCAPF
jgi:hypothetical protein